MALPVYLAMTAAELFSSVPLPDHTAWMACHFSCYGTGLSNCPDDLPPGSLLILNDRTPVQGHDPDLIVRQLMQITQECKVSGVLLDLQRPENEDTAVIVKAIVGALGCPVGVSEAYAKDLTCPVFLPPPPLHKPLKEYLTPWSGREIWLEAALDSEVITLTPEGSRFTPVFPTQAAEPSFLEVILHCRYHIEIKDKQVDFTLFRTQETLDALLQEAESLGVAQAVGLYQELGK